MVAPASVRRRRRVAVVVVVLGTSAVAASAPPPRAVVTEEMMLVETDALARAVGEARKARILGGWERRLVDRDEARAAAATIARGGLASARPDTEADAQVFERLGLLPAGARYVDLVIDAVARNPVGFYDPVGRRLFVPDYIPIGEQRSLLANQIAHALQDQRFGLRRFLRIAPDGRRGLSFDGELAREAVIEGDAAVLAMEAVDPRAPFPAPPELGDVAQRARTGLGGGREPREFLRTLLAFPIVEGFAFVARARGSASWAAVDAIWARPPESTAQVLHPERYERRLAPQAIELPALPLLMGEGLHLLRTDTFGELLLRLWLAAPLPGAAPGSAPAPAALAAAERAAAGWRGDRMAIYVASAALGPIYGPVAAPVGALEPPQPDAGAPDANGGGAGAALAWVTVWDADADADDFLQTAAPRLAALAAGGGGAAGDVAGPVDTSERPAVWRARADDTIYAVERRGPLVALLLGAPAAALPSLGTMLDAAAPRRGDRARRAREAVRGERADKPHSGR